MFRRMSGNGTFRVAISNKSWTCLTSGPDSGQESPAVNGHKQDCEPPSLTYADRGSVPRTHPVYGKVARAQVRNKVPGVCLCTLFIDVV